MAKVECSVTQVELESDSGASVPSVRVECGRCDHVVESFGTSEKSVKRCLALLREECPMMEENFYVEG